jgi:hypothetical protein
MTIEKRDPTRFDSAAMRAFVEKRVPDCKFLTDVGAEMVVQLPQPRPEIRGWGLYWKCLSLSGLWRW